MPSVLFEMLRSEVEWFPIFIEQCKRSLSYLDEQFMDHEAMKRVVECTCYREVQSVLNESRETAFKEEIWVYKQRAKKAAKIERRLVRVRRWIARLRQ